MLMPETGRGVALGIEVDDEHPVAELGQAGGQVDRRRRLADPALLVGDGEHPGKRSSHVSARRGDAPGVGRETVDRHRLEGVDEWRSHRDGARGRHRRHLTLNHDFVNNGTRDARPIVGRGSRGLGRILRWRRLFLGRRDGGELLRGWRIRPRLRRRLRRVVYRRASSASADAWSSGPDPGAVPSGASVEGSAGSVGGVVPRRRSKMARPRATTSGGTSVMAKSDTSASSGLTQAPRRCSTRNTAAVRTRGCGTGCSTGNITD